jgi:hypothetical protein
MESSKIGNTYPQFSHISGILSPVYSKFSKISKPMTKLLEKDAKYKWSQQCEEAFLTLKKLLMTAPVLAQPDIEKPFDMYCDASSTGIGGVLMQEGDCLCLTTTPTS